MTTPTGFHWDDRYLIGNQAIDHVHHEFAALLDTLLTADDATFPAALDAFACHTEAHFELEQDLMERHAFPARNCHVEEHDKVLASIREVQALVAGGDLEVGRELAQALADWFPGHSDYLDSALAIWIVKKTANGAPVVLRRSMQRT